MNVVPMKKQGTELVDVEALGDYAKEQWDLGDAAANEAGEGYWMRGTEAIENALPSVKYKGDETVEQYVFRKTGRNVDTFYQRRIALKEYNRRKAISNSKKPSALYRPKVTSVRGLMGTSQKGQSHMRREWTPEVDIQAKAAFREQTQKRIETAEQERKAMAALAKRLIDIGYKVLAKELHPDVGGSREAMSRLSEVKRRLYQSFDL